MARLMVASALAMAHGRRPVSLKARRTDQLASGECATWPMLFDILCSILGFKHQMKGRYVMSESNEERSSNNTVKVTLIVVVGLIILTCILAFTGISVAFLLNAPW